MDHSLTAQPCASPFDRALSGRAGGTVALFQDAARHDLLDAARALRAGNRRETAADLRRAQRTLHELMQALDPRVSPDLSLSLSLCYQRVFDAVTQAAAAPTPNAVDEAIRRLDLVRRAWTDACDRVAREDQGGDTA